jgi:hypothetical protein
MHSPIFKVGAPWGSCNVTNPGPVFLGVVVLLAVVVEHSLEDHQLTFYYSFSGAFDQLFHCSPSSSHIQR